MILLSFITIFLFKKTNSREELGHGVWCIMGNFNVVSSSEERRGIKMEDTSSQILERNLFNWFMTALDLEDVNPLGRKFTWYHAKGVAISRIDRVFILDEWLNMWGSISLCPLVLKVGEADWGPKPFYFTNY